MARAALCTVLFFAAALAAGEPYEAITPAQIHSITYDDPDILDDGGRISPVASGLDHLRKEERERFDALIAKIEKWPPSAESNPGQKTRNLLSLATFVDVSRSAFEAELAWWVFTRLQKELPKDTLTKICAWIVLNPEAGTAVKTAPELGYDWELEEKVIRERSTLYARKLLGRLLGKLPVKQTK